MEERDERVSILPQYGLRVKPPASTHEEREPMSDFDDYPHPDEREGRERPSGGDAIATVDLATGAKEAIREDAPEEVSLIHAQVRVLNQMLSSGLSSAPVSGEQRDRLMAELSDDEVDVLPTGEVYMSHAHLRERLTAAFGPLGWALWPLNTVHYHPGTQAISREFCLFINGRPVAVAFGSHRYNPTNKRLDFADSAEAAKSNALSRCCKDLGIALPMWKRRWSAAWRAAHCVRVWVLANAWQRDGGKVEAQWRRADDQPLDGEIGLVEGSPNADRYVAPRPPATPPSRSGSASRRAAPSPPLPPVVPPVEAARPAPVRTDPALAQTITALVCVREGKHPRPPHAPFRLMRLTMADGATAHYFDEDRPGLSAQVTEWMEAGTRVDLTTEAKPAGNGNMLPMLVEVAAEPQAPALASDGDAIHDDDLPF